MHLSVSSGITFGAGGFQKIKHFRIFKRRPPFNGGRTTTFTFIQGGTWLSDFFLFSPLSFHLRVFFLSGFFYISIRSGLVCTWVKKSRSFWLVFFSQCHEDVTLRTVRLSPFKTDFDRLKCVPLPRFETWKYFFVNQHLGEFFEIFFSFRMPMKVRIFLYLYQERKEKQTQK